MRGRRRKPFGGYPTSGRALSHRSGVLGWLLAHLRGRRYLVVVEIAPGVTASSSAAFIEHARAAAHVMMGEIPGANAEAVVYARDGRIVERVRRGA